MTNYVDKVDFRETYALSSDRYANQVKADSIWRASLDHPNMRVTASTAGTISVQGYVTPDEKKEFSGKIKRILN